METSTSSDVMMNDSENKVLPSNDSEPTLDNHELSEANLTEQSDGQSADDSETVAMETKEMVNPYGYTERKEFTSEIYKVEIENLPRNYGFVQLKKRLSSALKLNPHKIKAMPKTNFAFVTFKNEKDRDDALKNIEGHVWKGKVLRVKKAMPAADPLLKKRKQEAEQQQGAKKARTGEGEEDDTPPSVRLVKSVAPYWGMPYEEQLKKKQEEVADVLSFIAKNGQTREFFFKQRKQYDGMCCPLSPIVPSPQLENYRNKSEFSIGKSLNEEDIVVGFRFGLYKDGFCNVGPPDNVPTVPVSMIKVVKCFQQYLLTSRYTAFNPQNHTGHWHQLTVRTTQGVDIMAIAEFHPQQLTKEELEAEKEAMRLFFTDGDGKDSGVTSLYFRQSRARAAADHKVEPYELVKGQTHIYEEVLGLKFRISPEAFFQVNTKGAEVLYSQIADWCNLTPNTTVLDICCGTGTIGLTMAKRVEKVFGVEMCKQAVDDARENAKLNGITNVKYYCAKAEDVIQHLTSSLWSKDVIAIVDPPRAGLHKKVIKTLRGCHKLKRLVYVSCNARSAKPNFVDLIRQESKKHKGGGFLPVKAIPVDLFPQTPHCELVILFERDMGDSAQSCSNKTPTDSKAESDDKPVNPDSTDDVKSTGDDVKPTGDDVKPSGDDAVDSSKTSGGVDTVQADGLENTDGDKVPGKSDDLAKSIETTEDGGKVT